MSFESIKKIFKSIKKFDTDVEKYKQLVKTPSLPSAAYVNWAIHLAEAGDFEQAEEKLLSSTYLAETPEAYINLGSLRVKEKKFEEAKEFYIKALTLDNHNAKAYCFLANVLTEMQDYEKAEKNFEKAESIDKGNPDILINWGLYYLRQKKFEQAKTKFQSANRLAGINYNALYFLALIDMEQGNLDSASDKFGKIVSALPLHHEAYYYLAYITHSQGKIEQSIENALKSITIYPNKLETHMLLAENYMNQENKEECFKFYETGASNCLPNYFFLTSWGLAMQHFSMYEESKEKFNQAIELNENHELAYNCLGVTYLELKDYDNAILAFEKSIEVKPDNPIAFDNLGQMFFDKNEYQKAIEYFEKVLKISAKNNDVYGKIAKSYHNLEMLDKAEFYYEKALEYNPEKISTHLDYAQFLTERGEYEKALKKVQKAYKKDPMNYAVLNLLFYINYVLAKQTVSDYNREKAIYYAEELIKNYPEKFNYAAQKQELENKEYLSPSDTKD